MNKNIKIMEILKISILKPSQYVNLVGVKLRKILLAILIACMLPGIISGVSQSIFIGEAIDLVADVMRDDENAFEINNGILNFKKEEVKIEDNSSILYVNSNKEIKDIDSLRSILVHKDVYSAFLKDGVSVKYLDKKVEYKYTEILGKQKVNNESILKILESTQGFKYLIIPIEIIGIFVNMILNSFIIYLLGSLISKMKKIIIPSKQLYKMSIFALVLPSILQVNYSLGSYSIIIGGIYISLAINSIKNNLIKSQN